LQPLLFLQSDLRQPSAAAREPAAGTDRSRGDHRQAMMLRAVVFDFDGVLANSEPLHFRGFRDVLAQEGVDLQEADYYARYLGFDDAGAFRAIAAETNQRWDEQVIVRLVDRKAK